MGFRRGGEETGRAGEETRRRRGIERRVIVGRAWERLVLFRARERARWWRDIDDMRD